MPRRRGRPRGCRAGRRIQAACAAAIARVLAASLLDEEREELSRLRTENRRLRERLQAAVEISSRLRDRVWRLQDEAALARRGPPPPATCHPPRRHDQPPPPRPVDRRRVADPTGQHPQPYVDHSPSDASTPLSQEHPGPIGGPPPSRRQ